MNTQMSLTELSHTIALLTPAVVAALIAALANLVISWRGLVNAKQIERLKGEIAKSNNSLLEIQRNNLQADLEEFKSRLAKSTALEVEHLRRKYSIEAEFLVSARKVRDYLKENDLMVLVQKAKSIDSDSFSNMIWNDVPNQFMSINREIDKVSEVFPKDVLSELNEKQAATRDAMRKVADASDQERKEAAGTMLLAYASFLTFLEEALAGLIKSLSASHLDTADR